MLFTPLKFETIDHIMKPCLNASCLHQLHLGWQNGWIFINVYNYLWINPNLFIIFNELNEWIGY